MAKGERKVRKREAVAEGRECLLPHFGDNELLDQLKLLVEMYLKHTVRTATRSPYVQTMTPSL